MTDGRGGGVGRKREKGRGKDSEMKRGKEGVDHYRPLSVTHLSCGQ